MKKELEKRELKKIKGVKQNLFLKPVAKCVTRSERTINTASNHSYLVNFKKYNNSGADFNFPVVGSTSKPKDSRTTTPSKTLSTKSEIHIGKASSLPFNFIHALPLDIFTIPAPVLTCSSLTGLIPSSSASFLGNTVKLAPVSTKALTTFDFFFSKSDTVISTHECPMLITNSYNDNGVFKVFGEFEKIFKKTKEVKTNEKRAGKKRI